jgi:beta-1,4-mannosyltransferase
VWPQITQDNRIHVHPISEPWKPPQGYPRWLFLLWAPFKVLFQLIQLLWMLLFIVPKPTYLMVQNPPAIPTLLVAQLVAQLRSSKLIIDWHNFGYSILALAHNEDSWVVKLARWFEMRMGRHAYLHVTVTKAMKKELVHSWHIVGKSVVLYDHAPGHFRHLDTQETHAFLQRLTATPITAPNNKVTKKHLIYKALQDPTPTKTFLTEQYGQQVKFLKDRAALIVSSTSWTADEDFGILLDALIYYDKLAKVSTNNLPTVVCMITGRGPLKNMYEQVVANLQLTKVFISTVWLASDDYPLLLGSADLGVCLHKSSSGLDLPMKVVDMYGCGLPVLAYDYECIQELVKPDKTGLLFTDYKQLAHHLQTLLKGFPTQQQRLLQMRQEVVKEHGKSWNDNWNKHLKPLITI